MTQMHISIWHGRSCKSRCLTRPAGLQHFTCKFSHKVSFVKGPSGFRPRRLAQSLRRGLGLRHLTCKFPYKMALVLWNVRVHFDCAGSHKVWSPATGVIPGLRLRRFTCKFSPNMAASRCETANCISTGHARPDCGPQCGPPSWSAAFYL